MMPARALSHPPRGAKAALAIVQKGPMLHTVSRSEHWQLCTAPVRSLMSDPPMDGLQSGPSLPHASLLQQFRFKCLQHGPLRGPLRSLYRLREELTRTIACYTIGTYPLTTDTLATAPSLCNLLVAKTMAATVLVAMTTEPLSTMK